MIQKQNSHMEIKAKYFKSWQTKQKNQSLFFPI
jgi:hypothetical protein